MFLDCSKSSVSKEGAARTTVQQRLAKRKAEELSINIQQTSTEQRGHLQATATITAPK